MNVDPKNLISIISDKKAVLSKMIEIADRNHKQAEGCAKMRDSITRENPNLSEANLLRCMQISLQVSEKNSQDLMDIAQILLVYIQSNSFTTDIAHMANKMGAGHDALRAMFEAKMNGR